MKTNKLLISLMGLVGLAMTACEKTDRSFSLLDTGSTFQQSANYVPRPIDVLWVVDNSGSMQSSQDSLTANFQSFIESFQKKGYDFNMAVTGTDAWRSGIPTLSATNRSMFAKARPGKLNFSTNPLTYLTNSGFHFMNKTTPNLSQVFVTNASQGVSGTGNERAFSSFKEFLNSSTNSDFRRSNATLAIIILSDEDDFSTDPATTTNISAGYNDEQSSDPYDLPASTDPLNIYNLYRDSRIHSVSSYKDYLDGLVGAGNYSVSLIGVLDQACKTSLNATEPDHRIGRRYVELVEMTGGAKTSLCANFGESLEVIAKTIVSKNGIYRLDREPVIETLKVVVNGSELPESETWGWTYDPSTLEVRIGPDEAIPNEGDNVQIFFTPVRAAN